MRTRARVALLASSVALAGCLGGNPHEAQPPRHHDYSDQEGYDKQDHPEATARPPRDPGATEDLLPRSGDPARPNVKVELTVLDVISWDDVKIRGGVRGSVVRGVVSLTGWLAGGKNQGTARSSTTQFVVVQAGHEAQISLSDAGLRELVGPYAALRVAVLEANERGEVDVVVDPLVSPDAEGQMSLSTRVRVSSGEGLVVGGVRSESEGERSEPGAGEAGKRSRNQLAILTATVLRSKS